jgi:hypothetical protein
MNGSTDKQPEQNRPAPKAWSAPHLQKVGTINDVAGQMGLNAQVGAAGFRTGQS